MVAASPRPSSNFMEDLKFLDQNSSRGPKQKIRFRAELNLSGDLKF